MTGYRVGDKVLFETAAIVVDAGTNGVTIRFGDTELRASVDALTMVKRSVHVGDHVRHQDESAIVSQTLEEGVFLIRVLGRTGADAYRVAPAGDLRHEDAAKPVPVAAPIAAEPAVQAPEPVAEPATVVAEIPEVQPASEPAPVVEEVTAAPVQTDPVEEPSVEPRDELLLTTPVTEDVSEDEDDASDANEAPAGGVAGMATALSSMIGRRRNLETLGTTQEAKAVTPAEAESTPE